MGKFSFYKGERLKKEKLIQELFTKGSSFNLYPFRVVYKPNPDQEPYHQVLFTVTVRNFKKAVDRNKIKRRAREAYRLHKHNLNETPKLLIGFIYIAKDIVPYDQMSIAVNNAIEKLNKVEVGKRVK